MKIETADIFIDIVDNYGDMGWVLECLLMSWFPLFWRIVTDNPLQLETFFSQSWCTLPSYKIYEKSEYDYVTSSKLIILGLHADIELADIPAWRSVIRINYLTYDPWYEKIHATEHIHSRLDRPIRELVYSPLASMGGIWNYEHSQVSREAWLTNMQLPSNLKEKLWIPLFCYKETLLNLESHNIPENVIVFLIGNTLPWEIRDENIITLPWMRRDALWDLIDLGDISVLRGEISSARGLMSGKPYLWDMYKWLGGWNTDESIWFLSFIDAGSSYRKFHNTINGWNSWNIWDILHIYQAHSGSKFGEIPNFRKTLQKTIDSFGFSL